MSEQKVSQFSRFNKEKTDRPNFSGQRGFDRNRGEGRSDNPRFEKRGDNPRFGGGDRKGGDKQFGNKGWDRDNGEKRTFKQKGSDWYDSSEFCRVNKATGAVMWKEEFWTNKPPLVHMVEIKLGKQGDRMFVPSNWKFVSYAYSRYDCKCGTSFAYESAYNIHQKSCSACKR